MFGGGMARSHNENNSIKYKGARLIDRINPFLGPNYSIYRIRNTIVWFSYAILHSHRYIELYIIGGTDIILLNIFPALEYLDQFHPFSEEIYHISGVLFHRKCIVSFFYLMPFLYIHVYYVVPTTKFQASF